MHRDGGCAVAASLQIRGAAAGQGLFAGEAFAQGEVILAFARRFVRSATRTSLQVAEDLHQENPDPAAAENFLNHSCEPNAYVDFADLTLRALHPVRPGEELTFDYHCTEWDLGRGFRCVCGEATCVGWVRGFRGLSPARQWARRFLLSPFLRERLRALEADALAGSIATPLPAPKALVAAGG